MIIDLHVDQQQKLARKLYENKSIKFHHYFIYTLYIIQLQKYFNKLYNKPRPPKKEQQQHSHITTNKLIIYKSQSTL